MNEFELWSILLLAYREYYGMRPCKVVVENYEWKGERMNE